MSRDAETHPVLSRVGAELKKLGQEEEGASLVFAAITLWAVSLSIMFVYQMGLVSADRMQIQTAADAAAYSAAQVEANALNAIGQTNDALAYVNYVMLRYTIDAVVYGTIQQYARHNSPRATGDKGFVLMGGKEEGQKRYDHIKNLIDKNILNEQKGIKWLAELHYAGRVIMAATPRLARSAAAEVAGLNGAEFVGFSEDLDKAFNVGEGAEHGFSEQTDSEPKRMTPAVFSRYGKKELQEIVDATNKKSEKAKRPLPGADSTSSGFWFDVRTGKTTGEYYQVRLCWNKKDWDHKGDTKHAGSYSEYDPDGVPNAHWHLPHQHFIKFDENTGMPIFTGVHSTAPDKPGGHFKPNDDDPKVHASDPRGPAVALASDIQGLPHNGSHHMVFRCFTCNFIGEPHAPLPSEGSGGRAEILKSSRRPSGYSGAIPLASYFNTQYGRAGSGFLPQPLMIREPLLRSGITVATWRKARGIGKVFPASDWGMVAVASAQIGYQTSKAVLPLKSADGKKATFQGRGGPKEEFPYGNQQADDKQFRNLFYSVKNTEGIQFGARLVAISRKLTWHKDLLDGGKGLQALLENKPANKGTNALGMVWFKAGKPSNASQGPTSGNPQRGGQSLTNLGKFMAVESDKALEAFWH